MDIPDWLYCHMEFVKDDRTFTRYGEYVCCLFYGELVPQLMFESGLGKCEEFTVVAGAMAVSLGYDVRIVKVYPSGDHAFLEVWIDNDWIHLDPSEKLFDDPGFYVRKDRPMGQVIAFPLMDREDVTVKYLSSISSD